MGEFRESMTGRQRFIKTLTFDNPDRVFYYFGKPRRSTFAAWYLQGLPELDESRPFARKSEFDSFVGKDHLELLLGINGGIYPPFEVKILGTDEHGQTWRDSSGIVMHDAGRKLNTPGFKTRSYVSHPVKNRDDWASMKKRFDPASPERLPKDWDERVSLCRDRDFPVMVPVSGLYWKCRDWVGFEQLSMMFYDDPRLVHEMMEHVTVFTMELLDRAMKEGIVDAVQIGEDMAYKHASMISPGMFREFMLPRYKRLIRWIKDRGVPIVVVDSDGHIGELIPLWMEAGVDGTVPIEIAAHNDPADYRKEFGMRFALWGGIDKREIRSRERVYAEVTKKVPELISQGGYLPMIDHGIPPDATIRGFLYMCELIKAAAEGRPLPRPNEPLPIDEKLGPLESLWTPDLFYDPDEEEYRLPTEHRAID